MNLRIALLGATALTLLTAHGVLAGSSNESYVTQSGASNSASVTQSAGNNNDAGRSGDYMSQNGSNNVLKIVQDGDSGSIGVLQGTNYYYTPPNHLAPQPPQFSITYAGVDQNSSGSGSNSADLTQHGTSNTIGDLQQTALSTAGGNQAVTVQSGDHNYITHLWQEQVAGAAATNVANITESGSGNVIDRVDQKVQGNGPANQIIANISGTNNGTDDLTGLGGFYASRGFAAGATPSALIQNNYGAGPYGAGYTGDISGNYINLQVSAGSNNKFGLTQKGYANSAGTLTITGSNNMFGSYQAGFSNVISAGAIAGSGNDIGIWQSGGANTAHVSVLAYGNDYNQLSIGQSGYNNDASVDITGSHNGEGSFGSNVAGNLDATSLFLSNGSLWQDNHSGPSLGNHASYTVFGDSNDFALAQIGDQNHITGTVGSSGSPSGNNAAAVLQVGNGNTANFSQAGSGSNAVAISQ